MRTPTLPTLLSRLWFPVALAGLLLLALPGIVLFVLHLLRLEGRVNSWLEETFRLSYRIPITWWGALLLLLIPFGIILLYFLKLKRKPLQVPSTFLWRKSIEDVHVNSLFQWLRDNVLLLLQLLAVILLIFALMAFQVHGNPSEGKRYVIMIDNSASMSATDVAPSRLEVAQQEALQAIDSYTDNDAGMIIVFNATAKTLQPFTTDRELLRRAVKDIRQTQCPTRIEEALSLAESLANPHRSTENEAVRPAQVEPGQERTYVAVEGQQTEVHLFSDGRFPDVPSFSLGNLNLHYHPIGLMGSDSVDNVALVRLAASRPEKQEGRRARQVGDLDVFAAVRNYRNKPTPVKVQLEVFVNGELQGIHERDAGQPGEAAAQTPEVPARSDDKPGEAVATFSLHDIDERADVVLHAKLVHVEDKLAVDNEAWLVAGVIRKARILMVGTPGELRSTKMPLGAFFEQEAVRKLATVQYITPAELTDDEAYRKPARAGAFDLVIFDRCAPEKAEDMPLGNTFFIYSVPPPWKKTALPMLKNPEVKGWDSKHPLMRNLQALQDDVKMAEALRFELDRQKTPYAPLVETEGSIPLLLALNRDSHIDVVMTFPLINDRGELATSWFLNSLPIFLYNVLHHLGNVRDALSEEPLQPGQTKQIWPDAPVEKIEVIDPADNKTELTRGKRPDFPYTKTERVGVYQVRWDGKTQRSFAINLLDAEESDIEPRPEITIGSKQLGAGEKRSTPRETWMWFALAGLAILTIEWIVYSRRIFI